MLKIICALTLIGAFPLEAAQLVVSNPKDTQQSFPFQIAAHGFAPPQGLFFVAARDAVINNNFAVAVSGRASKEFIGITPPTATFDGVPNIASPLYGAGISNLAMLGSRPLVALSQSPSSLFLIEGDGRVVYTAQNIKNANGERAQSLLTLATTAPQITVPLEGDASLGAFAALGNDQGGFDGNGSGIALLFFKKFIDTQKKATFKWDIVDAQTGVSQYSPSGEVSWHWKSCLSGRYNYSCSCSYQPGERY